MTLSDGYGVYYPMGEPTRPTSDNTWDINDSNLPPPVKYDDFQEWPNSHCRVVYKEDVEDARRHLSGWAMRNTNNHNAHILKKSCIGIIVCNKDCETEKGDKILLRPAICDKARRKQLGKSCPNGRCDGNLVLLPCRGHSGYPVTHFWRHCNGCVYFQSKGTHDHPKPEIKSATEGKRRLQAIRPITGPLLKPSRYGSTATSPSHLSNTNEIKGLEEICSCPPFECVCRDSLMYGDVPSPIEHIQSYGEPKWKPSGFVGIEEPNIVLECQSEGYTPQRSCMGTKFHQRPVLKTELGVYSCSSQWDDKVAVDYFTNPAACELSAENQLPEIRICSETNNSAIDYHGSFNCGLGETTNSRQSCKLLEPSFNFSLTDNALAETPTLQALDNSVFLCSDVSTECNLNIPSISTQTPSTVSTSQNLPSVYHCSMDIGNRTKLSPDRLKLHQPVPYVCDRYKGDIDEAQCSPPKKSKFGELDVKPTLTPLEPVRQPHIFLNRQNIKIKTQDFPACQTNELNNHLPKSSNCDLPNFSSNCVGPDKYSHLNANLPSTCMLESRCKYSPHNCPSSSNSCYQQISTQAYNHNINITLQYK